MTRRKLLLILAVASCMLALALVYTAIFHEPYLLVRLNTGSPAYSLAYSSDGGLVAAGTSDSVMIWNAATGRRIARFDSKYYVPSVAFSPDGKLLASAADGVHLWDIDNRKLTSELKLKCGAKAVAFAPNGKLVAFAADSPEGDYVAFWEFETGKSDVIFRNRVVHDLKFSPDGLTLAIAVEDGIYLWDVNSGKERVLLDVEKQETISMAFSTDGTMLASTGAVVGVWDQTSGRLLTRIRHRGSRSVRTVAFSSDDSLLALGMGEVFHHPSYVMIVDPKTAVEVAFFQCHGGPLCELVFSPRGFTLATAGHDGRVKIWDMSRFKN